MPPGGVAGLTEAQVKLMCDDSLRQKFIERAVDVRERFAIDLIADKWKKLFEEIK